MLDTVSRDRIEYMEAEIRWLRDKIAKLEGRDLVARSRAVFGLTVCEASIFTLLVRCGTADFDALIDAVYEGRDEPRDLLWAIRHHVKRIRPKVARHGVEIETAFGVGYRMSDEARAKARAALKREMEAV